MKRDTATSGGFQAARRLAALAVACLAAVASASDGVSSRHFSNLSALQPYVLGGMEFAAGANTADLFVSRVAPPAQSSTPFPIWNNGVPHAFKIVHNAGGITGIEIDDLFTIVSPVTVDPATNALLITAFAADESKSVRLSNLKLTRPDFFTAAVPGSAIAPPTDFFVVRSLDLLNDGFILSGQVTLSWSDSLPPADQLWFQVTPLVFCEPCDVNCDGSVNVIDTQPFIDILAQRTLPPFCSPCAADCNFDGTTNQFDIQPFVECLSR